MDTIDWSSMVENMRKRMHVLLVDHHDPPIAMLEHFFLQVTTVKFASTAIAILSKGKANYDLLLENIHSPDACGYKLLQEALQIDLPVILLLEEDDIMLTKRALEVGALLCIKKPMTEDIARYLWQLVVWDKTRSTKKFEAYYHNMQNGVGEVNFMKANNYTTSTRDENGTTSDIESHKHAKLKCENSSSSSSSDNHQDMVSLRTKVWTEWTQELHHKFMVAVTNLGEGKCYPKDILEMMNVPGLTRMQVASHLQKCRSGSWIPPHKRKPKTSSAVAAKRLLFNSRKFGFMPSSSPSSSSNQTHHHIYINTPNHQCSENMDYSTQFPLLTTQYFEFPKMDTIIQSFCASEEEVPITYNVPLMNNANHVEKSENTSKIRDGDDDDNEDDGETDQLVVKNEGV